MAQQKQIKAGAFTFTCQVAGRENDPLVIFLHGFPEASVMWRGLMDDLADAGYFCLAPDMRGYSPDACPKGVKNYTADKLSGDIINLADAVKTDRFHLIGHDWGAAIGWGLVHNHPERIISWTALSVPHNRAFARAYKTDPEQKKKSRYIGYFLLPFLPEFMIRRNDFKIFRKLWKNSPPEEVDYYLSIFRRKASLTGALNYYRANLRKRRSPRIGDIHTPTLFIWGKHDEAIGEAAATGTEKFMKGPYTFLPVEGGHWLIQTNYTDLKPAILNHLKQIFA